MKQGKGFRFWERTGIAFILVAIVLLLSFPVKADEPYHLGHQMMFTGTGAVMSRECREGLELAVEEINKQGGFLGSILLRFLSEMI